MELIATSLPDVCVIASNVFSDERGYFLEAFRADVLAEADKSWAKIPSEFAQDNISHSGRNVLRGLHYQRTNPQGKLVRPVSGAIFDVAVDLRRSSPAFGKWFGTTLTAGDGRQLWIPPGFAHGFLVLSETADVLYKCTTVYHAPSDANIRWDDVTLNIAWPLAPGTQPILSGKDANAPRLADVVPFP